MPIMILLSPQNSAFEYHLLKYKIDYHIFRYIASTFKDTYVLSRTVCVIKEITEPKVQCGVQTSLISNKIPWD